MSFQLCPATAEDLPAIAQVAGQCFTTDTHTHLKAIAKGYGSNSADTARYHSEAMKPFFATIFDDPKRDAIVAKSSSGEIVGSVVWATKGYYHVESKPNSRRAGFPPEQPLHDTVEPSAKTPMTTSEIPPPSPPPSPMLTRTVANLKIVMDAAMKHYVSHLMPPDAVCRYIVSINVLPAWQKMGVGAALVEWGLEKARADGVFCWVSSSMGGARFFERLGFVEVGRLELDLDEWAEGIKKPLGENNEQTAQGEELWGKYIWNWMKWTP